MQLSWVVFYSVDLIIDIYQLFKRTIRVRVVELGRIELPTS